MRSLVPLSALIVGYTVAENAIWAQCGGQGFAGTSGCVSGSSCVFVNNWYSQCQPGVAPATMVSSTQTTAKLTTAPSATSTASSTGPFKWFGVDESGAEFGTGIFPGAWGKDFIFPSESSISTLMSQGFNIFRVPFSMERLVPNTLTGTVSTSYLQNLTATINYITGKGGYAIIDPHNFGRYYGSIITDVSGFQTFWTTVASNFKINARAIFDTNNEYHDMDQSLVLKLNQAAIDGIRAAGATSQYIMVEGNSWSGAWTWNVTNDNLKALTDPQGKIVYEMHQYLDSDGSGTSATCVSADIGLQRIGGATSWLRQNGKIGFLGEFAGGANSVCQQAVTGMLNHMKANSDVWAGACWWGGGPWWGDYIYGFEPPSRTAYSYYDSLLKTYAP